MKTLLLVVAVPISLIASTQTYTSQASFEAVAGGFVSVNWNNTDGLVSYSNFGGWNGQTYPGTVTTSPDGTSISSCVGGSFCPGPDGYAPRALFTLTFSRAFHALSYASGDTAVSGGDPRRTLPPQLTLGRTSSPARRVGTRRLGSNHALYCSHTKGHFGCHL